MAWCRQAASHYLSQCWPRSMSPYGVTRSQWVNVNMISYLYPYPRESNRNNHSFASGALLAIILGYDNLISYSTIYYMSWDVFVLSVSNYEIYLLPLPSFISNLHFERRITYRGISGSASACSYRVWCHGLTTFLQCGNSMKNNDLKPYDLQGEHNWDIYLVIFAGVYIIEIYNHLGFQVNFSSKQTNSHMANTIFNAISIFAMRQCSCVLLSNICM